MDQNIKNIGYGLLGRLIDYATIRLTSAPKNPTEQRLERIEKTLQSLPPEGEELTLASPTSPETSNKAPVSSNPTVDTIEATESEVSEGVACVSCCSDHFSTCAGLLSDEAMRMARRRGISDSEVIQRILHCSDQLNAMERDDLSAEKIARLPGWEKEIAIYAQNKGSEIRHMLNGISSVDDLEKAAIEIKKARDEIGTKWHKGRLAQMGPEEKQTIRERAEAIQAKLGKEPEPEMSLDEAKNLAAEQAAKEVESRWQSQEKK